MDPLRPAARALGGDIAGRDSIVCPGPGHSARDRSLSVKLHPDGSFTAGLQFFALVDTIRKSGTKSKPGDEGHEADSRRNDRPEDLNGRIRRQARRERPVSPRTLERVLAHDPLYLRST